MQQNAIRRGWRRYAGKISAATPRSLPSITVGSTHVRSGVDTECVIGLFVLASLPAMLVSAWSAGLQLLTLEAASERLLLVQGWGFDTTVDAWQGSLLLGLSYLVPLIVVSLAVSLFWALVFATVRGRSVDPGWPMSAWIYVLLLPADLSLPLAAIGMTFAAVIGHQIFGGTGRYIASPALLGALFVQFSYPDAGQITIASSWSVATAVPPAGQSALLPAAATLLAIACLAGALLLARAGAISMRILAGGLAGVVLAATIANIWTGQPVTSTVWQSHLVLGVFPVCLAFVVTDPTTMPWCKGARWAYGFLFAILVVAIRLLDPAHPEGSMFAALLATLSVPLIDYFVLRRHARAGGHLMLRT